MIRIVLAVALTLAVIASPAVARRHHIHHRAVKAEVDPRPRAWCGWFMRHHLGVADVRGNLARWWASYGHAAAGPAIGALVVWRHHVGKIKGQSAHGWIVLSGNDGHAVRERPRSLRGAIAFRWP